MTTEHGTGASSVKISTTAKGLAQPEIKVYDPHVGGDFGSMAEYEAHLQEIGRMAADLRVIVIARIRENGGRVVGDGE